MRVDTLLPERSGDSLRSGGAAPDTQARRLEVTDMLLADPKLRCPSCGAKNPIDAIRCNTCTRQLPRDQMPSQAAFEEAMYSQPVREKATSAAWMSKSTLGILFLVALVFLNYQYIGWGPSWAHRDMVAKGETWRTFRNDEFSVILPGNPEQQLIPTPVGDVQLYEVGVDDRWVSVLDADITAPAARIEGENDLYATVEVATGMISGDLATEAEALLVGTQSGTELSNVEVLPVENAKVGVQVSVTADYVGGPKNAGKGQVSARLVERRWGALPARHVRRARVRPGPPGQARGGVHAGRRARNALALELRSGATVTSRKPAASASRAAVAAWRRIDLHHQRAVRASATPPPLPTITAMSSSPSGPARNATRGSQSSTSGGSAVSSGDVGRVRDHERHLAAAARRAAARTSDPRASAPASPDRPMPARFARASASASARRPPPRPASGLARRDRQRDRPAPGAEIDDVQLAVAHAEPVELGQARPPPPARSRAGGSAPAGRPPGRGAEAPRPEHVLERLAAEPPPEHVVEVGELLAPSRPRRGGARSVAPSWPDASSTIHRASESALSKPA